MALVYEYQIEKLPMQETSEQTVARLNGFGQDGWCVLFLGGTDSEGNRGVWLMRERPPSGPPGLAFGAAV